MRKRLKSCPFCGKRAELIEDMDHHGEWFDLGCSDEECIVKKVFYRQPVDHLAAAIEAWNTRPTDAKTNKTNAS
jgi:hypothetical protein